MSMVTYVYTSFFYIPLYFLLYLERIGNGVPAQCTVHEFHPGRVCRSHYKFTLGMFVHPSMHLAPRSC